MKLRGVESKSILGSPALLLAPKQPYFSSESSPYRAQPKKGIPHGKQFPQYPISVWWGCPLIGTAFTALGTLGSTMVCKRAVSSLPQWGHLTLEFHAADLLSISCDALDPALAIQPDLRVSVSRKRDTFEAAIRAIMSKTQVVTLAKVTQCLLD